MPALAQEHQQHGALHGVSAGPLQRFLETLIEVQRSSCCSSTFRHGKSHNNFRTFGTGHQHHRFPAAAFVLTAWTALEILDPTILGPTIPFVVPKHFQTPIIRSLERQRAKLHDLSLRMT
jgi:hypothetical protein